MGIQLGINEENLTNIINQNSNLKIDESRYLGLINEKTPHILKLTYLPYIKNIYIDIYRNYVYGITIIFNSEYFDFYTLSETMEDKYGIPYLKTSKLLEWNSEKNTNLKPILNSNIQVIRLEYPSTIKAIDLYTLKEVNNILTQNIIKITNESTIFSNVRILLNEL